MKAILYYIGNTVQYVHHISGHSRTVLTPVHHIDCPFAEVMYTENGVHTPLKYWIVFVLELGCGWVLVALNISGCRKDII